VTKYDYTAIAVLIALMVLAAAEKFPRDKLLSAWGGIVFRFARPSARVGIAFFFALAIIGLLYMLSGRRITQRRSPLRRITRSARR
jgi:hypothetical protein